MLFVLFDLIAKLLTDFQLPLWGVAIFVLGSLCAQKIRQPLVSSIVFCVLNFCALYLAFCSDIATNRRSVIAYVIFVCINYLLLWLAQKCQKSFWVIPFLLPLIFLFLLKLQPNVFLSYALSPSAFVGISYLALRLSALVLDLRNGVVRLPNIFEYLSFAFLFPTLNVGPINPYRAFLAKPKRDFEEYWSAIVRIFIGLGKYQVLGVVFSRLTFRTLWADDYQHPPIDIFVSSTAYFLYLYCNFSGFCDMMIGIATLAGFEVRENFNFPFRSRNIKEFWNRWHITLGVYVRDVIFTPLSKFLVRALGPKRANEAIALSILVTFSLVGIWHGTGWNYLCFGIMHAFGLIAVHYYSYFLRRRYPLKVKRYMGSKVVEGAACCVTFIYVSLSFALFENSLAQLRDIIAMTAF